MESTTIPPIVLIKKICLGLELPPTGTALSMMYFHFYQRNYVKGSDFRLPHDNIVAITCIHLATKLQEIARKLRDILNVAYSILCPDEEPLKIGKQYWDLRESVSQCELLLLRVMRFEPKLELPHKMLYNMLHFAFADALLTPSGGVLTQVASTLLADLFYTSLCVKYNSNELAAAVLYTAIGITRLENAAKEWIPQFGVDSKTIERIAQSLLGEYRHVCRSKQTE